MQILECVQAVMFSVVLIFSPYPLCLLALLGATRVSSSNGSVALFSSVNATNLTLNSTDSPRLHPSATSSRNNSNSVAALSGGFTSSALSTTFDTSHTSTLLDHVQSASSASIFANFTLPTINPSDSVSSFGLVFESTAPSFVSNDVSSNL